MTIRITGAGLLALALTLTACDDTKTPPAAAGASAPAAAAPTATAQAFAAAGRVTDSQGNPIAGVTVDLDGTATENAGIVDYHPTTDASGAYRQTDMTPGSYQNRAWKSVSYNGKTYRLPMAPVQGQIEDEFLSKNGLTRDFVWKISGPVPSRVFDETQPQSYYGGSFKIFSTDYDSASQLNDYPDGTPIKVTLVPDGPLIDGSTGKTLTLESAVKKGQYTYDFKDVPIGRYTLTLAVGTDTMRLHDGDGHADSDYLPTYKLEFAPSGSAVRPYQMFFVQGPSISIKKP